MHTNIELHNMVRVMSDFIAGKTIEFRKIGSENEEDWEVCHCPVWDWSAGEYRVKEIRKNQIDWSHVSPKYNYMMTDCDGMTYLYEGVYPHNNSNNEKIRADAFASFVRGNVNGQESESLTSRWDND